MDIDRTGCSLYAIAHLEVSQPVAVELDRATVQAMLMPAAFADQAGLWTIAFMLECQVPPSRRVRAKLLLLRTDLAPNILRPGARFEVMKGPRSIAVGRVVKVLPLCRGDSGTLRAALEDAPFWDEP
jgi:hypothetical protein